MFLIILAVILWMVETLCFMAAISELRKEIVRLKTYVSKCQEAINFANKENGIYYTIPVIDCPHQNQ